MFLSSDTVTLAAAIVRYVHVVGGTIYYQPISAVITAPYKRAGDMTNILRDLLPVFNHAKSHAVD